MASLRILHVLTHGNVTRGGAIQALLLARSQVAVGHSVTLLCNSKPSAELDATFDPWKTPGITFGAFDMGLDGYENFREILRMRRYLKDLRPDVIHVHRDTALVFMWLATFGLDLPGTAPGPAFISQRGTTHDFRSSLIAHAHKSPRVHRIIGVAEAVKTALVRYGVHESKVEVVYGSCDLERFDPARADRSAVRDELGLRPEQKLIVQVGELHKKKAPGLLVKAARRVVAIEPDCVFAFVGKGTKERKVRELTARYGLGDKIRLLGFRTDIPNVYAAADIAVNSSIKDEGLTGALREALAMACPTVATNTDGNPELVRDGETGVLVDKGNAEALAVGILRLLRDPARGRAMGQRGRQLVHALMHPSVRLPRTEEIYRSVLERRATTKRHAGAFDPIIERGKRDAATTEPSRETPSAR